MVQPKPRHQTVGRIAAIALFALASIVAFEAPAAAQAKVDADFAKYCRTKFPNSIPVRRGNRRFCNQRGTLQGVDLGEACRLTTGSRRYEQDGARVLCLRGSGGAAPRRAGEPDFRRYCRTRHPGSIYVRRPAARRPGGVAHQCRQPGRVQGYVLHNIDLAAACRQSHRVSGYVISGNRVICGQARRGSTRRRYSAACRRVCNAQPSAGARNLCFRRHRLCQ